MRATLRAALAALLLWPATGFAVEPDEVLPDPALEGRARTISDGLRCPVCRNESIDESHAQVARDIRVMVRDLLTQGQTDEEVVQAVVDRYGEYVLLEPTAEGANLVLWLAPIAMLLVGLGVGGAMIRARSRAPETPALTAEEKARLDQILRG